MSKVQDNREFQALSEYVTIFVKTHGYAYKKFEKDA